MSEVPEVSDALISLVFSSDACSDTWDVDTKVSEQVAEPNPLIFRCFGRLGTSDTSLQSLSGGCLVILIRRARSFECGSRTRSISIPTLRKNVAGRRNGYKKAYVRLAAGQTIDFTGTPAK